MLEHEAPRGRLRRCVGVGDCDMEEEVRDLRRNPVCRSALSSTTAGGYAPYVSKVEREKMPEGGGVLERVHHQVLMRDGEVLGAELKAAKARSHHGEGQAIHRHEVMVAGPLRASAAWGVRHSKSNAKVQCVRACL